MNAEIAIIIKDLHKYYGRVHALRGVNLQVKSGEIFGFLGPNGAGKTTTIRCMLDLIRPQQGTIEVLGLNPQKQAVQVQAHTGYLPGELNLEPNLRVREVLRYLADLRGNKIDWQYARSLAQQLELDLAIPIKNLSKGNKRKVGVVQALMPRAQLLLLDEPTAGLDPLMQQVVYRLLHQAKAEGTTIFFSSHIISEVEAIAERVAIIRKGVITEEVMPAQLASMAVRKVQVQFKQALKGSVFEKLKGIQVVRQDNAHKITFRVEGDIDRLIKVLAKYSVRNLETEHPSLEEIFLEYYKNGKEVV